MGGGFIHEGQARGNSTSFAVARQPLSTTVGESDGDCVFGSVPSRVEVEKAISDLQRFMKFDGLLGLLYHHVQSKMLQAPGYEKLCGTFSMMLTEPAFRNMVVSISCDKAVWEAILNNKAVKDLQGSIVAAKEGRLLNCSEESDIAILIWRWILNFTKSKVLELVENFLLLVNEIFQPSPKEIPISEVADLLEEKVRSSLLLSVVILVIVVVTRNEG